MIKRKYLTRLGIMSDCFPETIFSNDPKSDSRYNLYKSEKDKTGVWSPDTWNLDVTAIMWLYERLIAYKKKASKVIDLTYHKFDFEDKQYTQLELINMMISLAEVVIAQPDNMDKNSKSYKRLLKNPYYAQLISLSKDFLAAEKYKSSCEEKFWKIWAGIFSAMWW